MGASASVWEEIKRKTNAKGGNPASPRKPQTVSPTGCFFCNEPLVVNPSLASILRRFALLFVVDASEWPPPDGVR